MLVASLTYVSKLYYISCVVVYVNVRYCLSKSASFTNICSYKCFKNGKLIHPPKLCYLKNEHRYYFILEFGINKENQTVVYTYIDMAQTVFTGIYRVYNLIDVCGEKVHNSSLQ